MARSPAASSPIAGSARRSRRRPNRRLEQDEVQALHRRHRRLGGAAGHPRALAASRAKHGVSVANVATRWVLEQPAVAAVIVGARLGEREHRADNLRALLLRPRRRRPRAIDAALAATAHPRRLRRRIPPPALPDRLGRPQPPSERLAARLPGGRAGPAGAPADRFRQPLGADLRLQPRRPGRRPHPGQRHHGHPWRRRGGLPGDPARQTVYILDKIAASIAALGGTLDDVVRTRIYLATPPTGRRSPASMAATSAQIRPANTLVEVARLVGDYEVEIEAEAVVEK